MTNPLTNKGATVEYQVTIAYRSFGEYGHQTTIVHRDAVLGTIANWLHDSDAAVLSVTVTVVWDQQPVPRTP